MSLIFPAWAWANFDFNDTPLKEVIHEIQQETGYFFLYRESQIAGIRITMQSSSEDIIQDLEEILKRNSIDLTFDAERGQILLTRAQSESVETRFYTIKGQIVDNSSGERLAFATISWIEDEKRQGVIAGASGNFTVERLFSSSEVILNVSYVGYESRTVQIDLNERSSTEDLTIRLNQKSIDVSEIVISGFSGYNAADTLLTGMIDAGRFSPMGESSSIRALQAHPSVTIGTALNNGLNVRGSTPDGFLVQLDGMSIFNQSHLFGLLDSFNDSAIQTSGYYVGVTPAQIDVPTGGTLKLITRTGSRNEFKNRIGLSNTSVSGTFEGPIGERSSWLFSARTSYMNQADWFNNEKLIQWGLDIDRPARLANDMPDFTDLVLRPGASSARFVDLHGKILYETSGGGRFVASGYFGGDETSQLAERRTRKAGMEDPFVFEEVETSNLWGNSLLSLGYERQINSRFFSSTTAGFSSYQTDFRKDDFVYKRITPGSGSEEITIFTNPFRNRSTMNEIKVQHEFQYNRSKTTTTAGASLKYYKGEYSEASFGRPAFFSSADAFLSDAYLQSEWRPVDPLHISLGARGYYFSPTNRIYASPRVQLRYRPADIIELRAGYSVNHQFLHRVSLQNATTAEVWILSTENQPPALANQYSVGFEIAPSPLFYLSIDAYKKHYDRLRVHELNTQSLENTFSGTPWFFQNDGNARGIEVILRNRWSRYTFTQSYTLSRMVFKNEFLFGGEEYFAEWDRTHSYNAVLETRIGNRFNFFLSWLMMSGAPDAITDEAMENNQRLDAYYRMDATIAYNHQFSNMSSIDVSFSAFNLLNRKNVWYRDFAFNFDETRSVPRLTPVVIDVLDLGFQPSFNISYTF